MGRLMPTECAHGNVVDWGDFGPEDGSTPICDICEAMYRSAEAGAAAKEKAFYDEAYWRGWNDAKAESADR